MSDDYYRLLGVDRRASQEALKCAFREQLKHVHPDTHPDDPFAADNTRQLVEAYRTLRNPSAKRKYDSMLAPSAPLFRPSSEVPALHPLISRMMAIAAFVIIGLLAAVIVGAFTDGRGPSTLAALPIKYCPARQACAPPITEPLVWDSIEWYHAQRYQLGPTDTRAASDLKKAYAEAVARAVAAGDHVRASFYAQAANAVRAAELHTPAWPQCAQLAIW